MSLLAPLYIAGLLAVAAPIVFHLIRRMPTGRQTFSSLMFLDPSPPRITKRSRLNNILLLLLRASALALLVFAFARPFFKQRATADVSRTAGKRIALLVDTSASMQRGSTWENARVEVERTLQEVSPTDEVGLFFFDRNVRPGMTFREWNELDGSRRVALLRARLREAAPTWDATDLAGALSTVADLLSETDGNDAAAETMGREIVLISDLQRGSRFESLQGYEWPRNVTLQVKPVAPQSAGNASMQLVEDRVDAPADRDGRLRVRLSNQPLSQREQFTLQWANEQGPIADAQPVKAYVAPGRNQVVRVARPTTSPAQADRLVLAGDDAEFDNTLFIAPTAADAVRIVFFGDDAPDDTKGLLYFLRSAAGDTPRRKAELTTKSTDEGVTDAHLLGARLVVVAAAVPDERATVLRRFAEAGGDVLWVLMDANTATGLSRITQSDSLKVQEAAARNYSLISRVATDHPLFAPFADPRFGDFTKIHFWNHRRVTLPDEATARSVAWFDNGDPFLIEHPIGKGRLFIMTAGWHPADSQLALSTKFVPLIDGLLRRPDGALAVPQYAVHDRIALPAPQNRSETRTIRGPDGREVELPASASTFDGADRPGIYRLQYNGAETPLAVNLSPDESRTHPLAVEELEQLGAVLAKPSATPGEITQQRRQLQVVELENRQKLWRWLIVGVLALLVFETALAGHLAHRSAGEQVVTA
ncbi:MAG TPA: BatA domain-containing protein [Tepidisphaeraceae bacterium]|nr:BatA domain-containing protein [Tepidisphaeraceae bacterium]